MSQRWVLDVPVLNTLNIQDKNLLISATWSQLFILTAAQVAFTFNTDALLEETTSSRTFAKLQLEKLQKIITRIVNLQANPNEVTCMKAICLFNPEVNGISDSVKLEALQDQAQLMLQDACLQRYSQSNALFDSPVQSKSNALEINQSAKHRYGKCLLILPALKEIESEVISDVFFKDLKNPQAM